MENKFTFIHEFNSDQYGSTKVVVESDNCTLDAVLQDFINFLKACGYSSDQVEKLDFVEDET